MTDTATAKAIGMGIAGGAIAAALVDLLIAKGLIDDEEARGLLESAMYRAATWHVSRGRSSSGAGEDVD